MCAGSVNRSIAVSAIVLAATIMPLAPIDMPPAATACQLCAGVPGHPGRRRHLHGRHAPAHVAHVGRCRANPACGAMHLIGRCRSAAACRSSVLRIVSANARSSGVYSKPPTLSRCCVHDRREVAVRQDVPDRAGESELHLGVGAERGAAGGVGDALPDAVEHAHVVVARVVVDLGEIGHDVGRAAAVGDHVVDARIGRNVLAHQVDHGVHRFDAVERRAAAVRRARRVRRHAAEAELGGDVGQRARRARPRCGPRHATRPRHRHRRTGRRAACRPCPSRLPPPGVPKNLIVPPRLLAASHSLTAIAAAVDAVPNR